MKTKYEEIVNVNAIGKAENPISLNEILKKANDEQLTPSKQNKERVLFIGIDVQQDFMDNRVLHDTLCDGRKLDIEPDIVGDFRKIPFDNNTFHIVVFDSPHLLKVW